MRRAPPPQAQAVLHPPRPPRVLPLGLLPLKDPRDALALPLLEEQHRAVPPPSRAQAPQQPRDPALLLSLLLLVVLSRLGRPLSERGGQHLCEDGAEEVGRDAPLVRRRRGGRRGKGPERGGARGERERAVGGEGSAFRGLWRRGEGRRWRRWVGGRRRGWRCWKKVRRARAKKQQGGLARQQRRLQQKRPVRSCLQAEKAREGEQVASSARPQPPTLQARGQAQSAPLPLQPMQAPVGVASTASPRALPSLRRTRLRHEALARLRVRGTLPVARARGRRA